MTVTSKTMPLVSVIITAYNRQLYIKDAIESVLNSSFQDFELLIVDDSSTDGSFDIIQNYAGNPKIRIYRNDKNLGQFENRNYSASLAKGKYIKFLDSDDTIYTHGLASMVDIIEQFPNAGAAISHNLLNETKPYPIYMNSHDSFEAFYFGKGFPNSGPSAAIINRKIFEKVNGYPKPYYVGTDLLLWLEIAAITGIVKMPPCLIWYREHEGQDFVKGIISNEYLEKNFQYYRNYLFAENSPLSVKEKINAEKYLKKRYLRDILNLFFKKKQPLNAIKIFLAAKFKISDLYFF